MTDAALPHKSPFPVRRLLAGGAALLGGFVAFSIMCADTGVFRWAVPSAIAALFVATVGVIGLIVPRGAPQEGDLPAKPFAAIERPLMGVVVSFAALLAALIAATSGRLRLIPAAFIVPASFLALVVCVFRLGVALGPLATDETGQPRPLHRRHGFGVIALATLLYLPFLGSFSLSDPWETRYGEVAREILARADWISIWWAQEGWEFTKPVLDFWLQAVSMGVLGFNYHSDHVLSGAAGVFARPEWAARMPVFLLSLAALYLLYKAVAITSGRRAGLLGAMVLATAPHWFLLSHQSITDMPFVAPMSAAIALALIAANVDPEGRVRSYAVTMGRHTVRFDARHVVVALILMTALPQILYLASRNLELQWVATPHGFRPHADTFQSGSPENCGLPGNQICARQAPQIKNFTPALQAGAWTALLGGILWILRGERRTGRLCMLGAWYFASISTMAKGPGGLVLPIAAIFVYVMAGRDKWQFTRLAIPTGVAIVILLVVPWYAAMYMRHGPAFTDNLIFKEMLQRATAHIHDTNEGDDTSFRFYVWQLGYSLFPWTGLVPAALVGWMRRSERDDRTGRALPEVIFLAWFVFAFALFTKMPTKFHHYIFPAVPPAAMLTGLLLDRLLGTGKIAEKAERHEQRMLSAAGVAAAIVVALVGRDLLTRSSAMNDVEGQARLLHLFTYQYHRPWPDSLDFTRTFAIFTGLCAVACLLLAVEKWRRYVVPAMAALSIGFATWGLDVYLVKAAPHWGQRELFEKYYQVRQSPDDPIIAYQMNWKGENFYTGNHVPAFVSSGQPFTNYLQAEKAKGKKTFYFVTEHSRTEALRGELGRPPAFEPLTDKVLNNKFALIRASFD